MNQIYQPDPYLPVYELEKQKDPTRNFVYRQFRDDDVKFVDMLVEQSLACNKKVVNDKDWDLVKSAFTHFANRWPEEFKEFKESVDLIRRTRNAKGYSKTKEIQYVGALPMRFERILKICFPENELNKEFLWKLVKKMPIFKVANEKN